MSKPPRKKVVTARKAGTTAGNKTKRERSHARPPKPPIVDLKNWETPANDPKKGKNERAGRTHRAVPAVEKIHVGPRVSAHVVALTPTMAPALRTRLTQLLLQIFCDNPKWSQRVRHMIGQLRGCTFIVSQDGRAVAAGMLESNADPPYCTVRMLATQPQFRRRGWCRVLHSCIQQWAAQHDMPRVTAEVAMEEIALAVW